MPAIKVKPIDESLDFILTHRSSVARFGDGEMDIVTGHGIPYQDYDETLASQLRHIMGQESSEDFLVCLSDVFEGRERYNSNFSFFWDGHLERFAHLYEEICQAPWYGSTFISRPYIDLEDKSPAAASFAKLKQIWEGQDVLIVEGETSRSGVGNDLFAQAKSVSRIICPSKNAYVHYDEIAQAIRQYGKEKLVLLMLGPTAKVLSYKLAKEGFWTIDLGHIDSEYEWFLMGATHKVKLGHKHTAEHNYDEGLVLAEDVDYQRQIVARVPDTRPLISVIVPVYNVEAYLEECVRSILNQTYKNLELILVNDGSTDGSGELCDRYAAEDVRVRVIHQENAGLSAARNTGIETARGEYLTFVDSDDGIHEDCLKDSVEQAGVYQADIVVSNFFQYSEIDQTFYYYVEQGHWGEVELLSPQEAVQRQSEWKHLNTATFVIAVAKLYKRDLFKYVRYPIGKVHEDEYTTHKLFLAAQQIVFLNKDFYMYRRRDNSLMTSTYSVSKAMNLIEALEERLLDLTLAGYDVAGTRAKLIAALRQTKRDLEERGLAHEESYHKVLQRLSLVVDDV